MFKSRKKRQQQQQQLQQQKLQLQQQQHQVHVIKKAELEEYKLLDDLKSANDFRSSVILPQLGKDMTTASQEHLASSPLSMPSVDGSKQYQDLAAWRHERSQHRYSNGLFGGKQRDRPKVASYRQTIEEEEDDDYHPEQEILREEREDQRYSDAILEEEEYEPDSDMEENYFFKDFSENSQPKQPKKPKQKSRQKKPAGGLFDLSSFARDLHDHRLSVVQPRESRIIMTEEDEQELEKLLTLQRKRMSMMTTASDTSSIKDEEMPPLPSLENINYYKPPQQQQKSQQDDQRVNIKQKEFKEPEAKIQEKPKEIVVHDKEEDDIHNVDSIKSHPIEPVEINKDVSQSTTASATSIAPSSPPPKSPRVLKPVTSVSTSSIKPVTSASTSSIKPVTSISTSINTSSIHYPVKELEPVKRSVSTTSIRSQHNKLKTSKLSPIPEPTVQKKKAQKNAAFRKSMSMDDISSKLEIEPSITSAALEWIDDNHNVYNNNNNNNNDIKKDSAGTNFINHQYTIEKPSSTLTSMPLPPTPPPASQPKSLGLFGSLRQVSRSKTHSGHKTPSIKGLVRNLSSSHYHHSRKNQQDNNGSDQDQQRKSDQGMSRAAMAVIQHNVAKHEKDKITPIIPSSKKRNSDENKQPSSTDGSSRTSGAGILSQFLARASKQRRSATKTINMEDEKAKDARKRAQVVRRTIIYVQPNSLHDLLKKNGGDIDKSTVPPPPVPALYKSNTTTPEGSLSADDETVKSQEYVTATKVMRQTSVRKRIVENTDTLPTEQQQPTITREGSRKRWQLKSMDENEVDEANNNNSDYMEGVELREMSDGSVVWGIVKKQGNRKSFYSPQNNIQEEVEEDEDEEEEEKKRQELKQLVGNNKKSSSKHLQPPTSSPPPIPKRSPRRQAEKEKHSSTSSNDQASTTDIYYSDVSLPNLLQMMKKQQQEINNIIGENDEEETKFDDRAMASVDEQLDEMMRSLTSQH